jgi:hypothetical protein
MKEKIEQLIEKLNAFQIEDEDLKSDLDILVNGESSSDLSLKTLLIYLNNDSSVEYAYSDVLN